MPSPIDNDKEKVTPLRVVLCGAGGRMGRMVIHVAQEVGDVEFVGLVERPGHEVVGKEIEVLGRKVRVSGDPHEGDWQGADVGIDFSQPEGAAAFASAMAESGVPVLVCTTGLGDSHLSALRAAAEEVPVLYAPNTSVGIYVLRRLAREARRILGPTYDIELVEVHHRHKKDAPSGTARALVEDLLPAHGTVVYGRQGQVGERSDREVGVFALRGGEAVGEHTVYFLGPWDRIELTHRAMSRALFAHGALMLARRLVRMEPGLYSVDDLLSSDDCH